MNQSLDAGFVQVAQVGSCLSGFLAHQEGLWGNKAEGVDNDFTFNGLDRIDHNSDGAGSELFEGLLSIDIDGGEPAAEAWVGMVPAYYCFRSGSMLAGTVWTEGHADDTFRSAVAYPSSWSGRLDLQPQR